MAGSESMACPQCQGPRDAQALYCPFCGAVFARLKETPPQAASEPEPVNPLAPLPPPAAEDRPVENATGDLYEPPSPEAPTTPEQPEPAPQIYQGPAPAGTATAAPAASNWKALPRIDPADDLDETPLTRHLLLSILVAGLLFVVLQVFVYEHVGSGSEDLDSVRAAYTRTTGLTPPPDLTDATRITFVGRHILMLAEETDEEAGPAIPSFVVAYYHGFLGGEADGEELKRNAQEKIQALGIPVYRISQRETELRGESVPTETFGMGSPERSVGRIVYRTLTLPDGRSVLVVLGGSTRSVTQYTREFFS